jgi:hypothetical protein
MTLHESRAEGEEEEFKDFYQYQSKISTRRHSYLHEKLKSDHYWPLLTGHKALFV